MDSLAATIQTTKRRPDGRLPSSDSGLDSSRKLFPGELALLDPFTLVFLEGAWEKFSATSTSTSFKHLNASARDEVCRGADVRLAVLRAWWSAKNKKMTGARKGATSRSPPGENVASAEQSVVAPRGSRSPSPEPATTARHTPHRTPYRARPVLPPDFNAAARALPALRMPTLPQTLAHPASLARLVSARQSLLPSVRRPGPYSHPNRTPPTSVPLFSRRPRLVRATPGPCPIYRKPPDAGKKLQTTTLPRTTYHHVPFFLLLSVAPAVAPAVAPQPDPSSTSSPATPPGMERTSDSRKDAQETLVKAPMLYVPERVSSGGKT